jgi:hypothetical protein
LVYELELAELQFVKLLPPPPSRDKSLKWLLKLRKRRNLTVEPRNNDKKRRRPRKNRQALYHALAWVWNDCGKRVSASGSLTTEGKFRGSAFVRFVADVLRSFPDLKLEKGLTDDIGNWLRELQPLTKEERRTNRAIIAWYQSGVESKLQANLETVKPLRFERRQKSS